MLQPSTITNVAHWNTLQCIDAENKIEESMLHTMNALEYVNDFFTSAIQGKEYDKKYDGLVEIMTTALTCNVHPDHFDIPKEFTIDYSGYTIKFRENLHGGKGKYSAEIMCEKPGNSTRELKFEYDEENFKGIATLLLLRQWDSGIIRHGSALLRHSKINLDDANLENAILKGVKLNDVRLYQTNLKGAVLQAAKLNNSVMSNVNLQGANLQGANLQGANLQGANLQGANLQGASFYFAILKDTNLQEANLQEADFGNAVLEETNLQEANLQGAEFDSADLEEINLQGANLQGADFENANLKGADFENANLKGADFENANLKGANLKGANLKEANLKGANLKGANLQGADFENANLKGADFEKANLKGTDFENANLKGANLKGANLKEAYLQGANLQGANLQGASFYFATLKDINLQEANLQEADFGKAVLEETNLQEANLQGAEFDSAVLEEINLQGANLKGADFENANLKGANLKGADFENANLKGANLKGADFENANLKGVDLKEVSLEGVDMEGVSLEGVDFSGVLNSLLGLPSDWDKDELETYLRHRDTEDYKTEAAILKQKCDIWRGEAEPGHGELRNVAIERINQCLNDPKNNPNLNLTDLRLTSLPPLPYCNNLYVSEELLEQLLSLTVGNNSSDKIRGYVLDNFMHHHFEKLFDEASDDKLHFIRKNIVDSYKLDSYYSNWMGFYEIVRENFNSSKQVIKSNAYGYLSDNLEKFSEHQNFSVDELKSELENFLESEFCERAHILGKRYQN